MTPKRKRLLPAIWLLAGFFAAAAGLCPGDARGAGAGSTPLTMEELEVRGFIVKPDRLYLPVPKPIFSFAPVRFDIFTEDLVRPIALWEMTGREPLNGGPVGSGNAAE